MLERLTHLDAAEGKKHRDQKNRIRDVLIGHTAIKTNATLISEDVLLRQLVSEFDGRAVSTSDIKRMTRVRWKVGLFRAWIVGSICWIAYWFWDNTSERDLTCLRQLIGVDKGEQCEFKFNPDLGEFLIETFRPPLLVGIAILAVVWIVAGFQRRAGYKLRPLRMKPVAECQTRAAVTVKAVESASEKMREVQLHRCR
jgi:hypothetical protein